MLKLVSSGGVMIDTDAFYIIQKASGIDELIFNISVFDKNYPKIMEETVIEYEQPYLIKAIDAGPQTVKVKCQLNLDELKANLYPKYSNGTKTLGETINKVLPKGWSFIDQSESTERRKIEGGYTPYEIIMECINTYDVAFRFDVKGKKITAYKTDNFKPLGAFASGDLNLKEINYKGKSTSFFTRLYAYGKNGISFASINEGKPYIDNFQYSKKVICAYWQDDRYEEKKDLLEDAKKKLNAASIPDRIYECTVADLAKTNPDMYSFQDFSLFSIIRLIDDIKKTSVYYQVVEYQQYPFYPEKNVVTLSSTVPKIQESVKDIKNEITNQNSSFWSVMRNAIDSATDWVSGVNGGYVVLHKDESGIPYELVITDTQDLVTAKNVWRWNQNGLEQSTHGYSGPYNPAIKIDGTIVADFITAGTMLADRIRGGTLELGGKNNESGVIVVRDEKGENIVLLNKDGVYSEGRFHSYSPINKQSVEIASGNLILRKNNEPTAEIYAVNEGAYKGMTISTRDDIGKISLTTNSTKVEGREVIVDAVNDTIIRTNGTQTNWVGGNLMETIEGRAIINDRETISGRAEFSDGTYLEFEKGRLVGGNSKNGGF